MAFSRSYLLLMHNSDATKLAYPVFVEGYEGDQVPYAKDLSRNVDGDLLVVRAVTDKREFHGNIWLDSGASGTIQYDAVTYSIGTPAQLKAALEATDLKAKAFDDSAFWSAECATPWNPRPGNFGGSGTHRVLELRLVEK